MTSGCQRKSTLIRIKGLMVKKRTIIYLSKPLRSLFILLFTASQLLIIGQTSVPNIFGNHMVLQRDLTIPVWGKSVPGNEICIEIAGNREKGITDENGNWFFQMPGMHAGGPYIMKIYEGNDTFPVIQFNDVLVGDVWLASGQSNMEMQVQQSMNAEEEIKNAEYPNLRLFLVPQDKKITIQDDIKGGSWRYCDSASVKTFSAVAYFFARKIHKDINIPVGVIQSTWGGTPVKAWTSREQLLSSPITRNEVIQDDSVTPAHFVKDSLDLINFWDIVYNPKNETENTVTKSGFDDSDWQKLNMPSTFKDWDMPFYEGIIWMRKSIKIPKEMLGNDLSIHLGKPEMNYSLYFNGKEICKTVWNAEPKHNYIIPAKFVNEGNNLIAVRLAVLWGGGGLNPPADSMYITDGNTRISIAGKWRYKKDLKPKIPYIKNYHKFPSYLFNAMINPLIPFGIKGVIWYQGEEDVSIAKDYQTLFPMMINDWRIRWKEGYLPFLYVQLANYMKRHDEPTESEWAELREAQTMTLSQPNTGMICTIDIGEADNIHPKNKQEVGRRLALLAENMVYKKSEQVYGPMFQDFTIDGNKIVIRFSETGSGLTIRNDEDIKGFAVAGKNRKFYWAKAVIDGSSVIVSSEKVSKPVAVRYAWADNPECNLINKEGLPAVPFRTDTWNNLNEK